MIIRKRKNEFVMIKQHDHAQISKHLYRCLKYPLLPKEYQSSLEYAIAQHDCGWIAFDESPFWNDKKQSPFSFMDFPIEPKIALYEHGINLVEEHDLYAALLCSEHYTRFLKKNTEEAAKTFINRERARKKKIKSHLNIDESLFLNHYKVLQFFDNLSLYICLNEPGTAKENEHYFFKKGMMLPRTFAENQTLTPNWKTKKTIELDKDLFKESTSISFEQKVISRDDIKEKGMQDAYSETDAEEVFLYMI